MELKRLTWKVVPESDCPYRMELLISWGWWPLRKFRKVWYESWQGKHWFELETAVPVTHKKLLRYLRKEFDRMMER